MKLTELASPTVRSAARPVRVERDDVHRAVDALVDQAHAVTDSRLQNLLFRAGCALLDHELQPTAHDVEPLACETTSDC